MAIIQRKSGRQFPKDGIRQLKRQACIATFYWMTDLIALAGVREGYVIGICHNLLAAHVPQLDSAIGEYEVVAESHSETPR